MSVCKPPELQETEFAEVIVCEVDWVSVIEPQAVPSGKTVGRCGLGNSEVACERAFCANAPDEPMARAMTIGTAVKRDSFNMVDSPG